MVKVKLIRRSRDNRRIVELSDTVRFPETAAQALNRLNNEARIFFNPKVKNG